jgi:ribosomal protein S12 methylthiotransferase accessory factor
VRRLGRLLAIEARRALAGRRPGSWDGSLLLHDLGTETTTTHGVVPMPWCEVCGGAGRLIRPSGLRGGARDPFRSAGGLRKALPGWVDERTGVIAEVIVSRSKAGRAGPLVTALARCGHVLADDRVDGREMAAGYGRDATLAASMRGAVAEAIERYSACQAPTHGLRRAALRALGDAAFDPRWVCRYSEEQYRQRAFPYRPVDPARPLWWVRGRWLDTGRPVWLPASFVYLFSAAAFEDRIGQVTSSGLAAGSGVEDAGRRALYELAERDAFMITWLARRPGRRIVLDGGLDACAVEVARRIRQLGGTLECYALDAGLPVPVVLALVAGDGRRWPGFTVALGAHADLAAAVRKAILEQWQVGLNVRQAMRTRSRPIPARPERVIDLVDHGLYYVPPERRGAVDFLRRSPAPPIVLRTARRTAEPPLDLLARRFASAGSRVAMADVTSPDVALSPFRVVRALGVGLQPIYFGESLRPLPVRRLRRLSGGGLNRDPQPAL